MDAGRHRPAHRAGHLVRVGLAHSHRGRPRRVGVSAAGRALLAASLHRAVTAAAGLLRAALREPPAGDLLEVSAGDVAAPRAGRADRSARSADRRDECAERCARVRARAETRRRPGRAPHVAALGHVLPGAVLPRDVSLRSADEPRVARRVVGRIEMGGVRTRARSRHHGGGARAVRRHASAHRGGARPRGGRGAGARPPSRRGSPAIHAARARYPVRGGCRRRGGCRHVELAEHGLCFHHTALALHEAIRPVRRARLRRPRAE